MEKRIGNEGKMSVLLILAALVTVILLSAGFVFLWAQSFTDDAGSTVDSYNHEKWDFEFTPPGDDNYFDLPGVDADDYVSLEESEPSYFGADVDTGSYSIMRAYVNDGRLPPEESIRAEEYMRSTIQERR